MFKANVADNRALHIVFVDDIKCNGTETHTAIVGENITYACSFKYQGLLYDGYVQWRDHIGNNLTQNVHLLSNDTEPTSAYGTCYTGESTVGK